MIWFVLALVALAVLVPLIGADTRDGRDWQPSEPDPFHGLRTSGSPAPAASARTKVAAHHPRPVAG
ncbi:hypothetical protein [Planobispora longispora]|uniref:Uncharacterized protein n=1 Tax=Planobispora longispora TaxID=28887 RepID=A0A8J3W2L6_9ACTN|nr:hypothetical protein [Planobispora longispora]BFE86675.1 hypothetical protein GCM10020093_092760 [Planobispora longispora]GIH74479.1 hypothetical protein Plo01_09080 [Planobispora longispora]